MGFERRRELFIGQKPRASSGNNNNPVRARARKTRSRDKYDKRLGIVDPLTHFGGQDTRQHPG